MIAPNDSPKQGGLPQAMASTRRLAAILDELRAEI
jgi:hypothetical protein